MGRAVKFLYLSQEDVIAADGLNMVATIEAVERVLAMAHRGECIEPGSPAIYFEPTCSWRVLVHPAYVGGDINVAGMKYIPTDPENPRKRQMPRATSLIVLSAKETGWPLALMDGTVISAMRTAAVTGVACKYLARKESQVAAFVGAGPINRLQLMAVAAVLPSVREARVHDVWQERAEGFAREMSQRTGVWVRSVASAQEATKGADVVVFATVGVTMETGYAEAAWVKPGAFLSEVSANDVRPDLISHADRIVVISLRQLEMMDHWIGRLLAEGRLPRGKVSSLGEIITGEKPGMTGPNDRVFLRAMGLSVEDVMAAYRVYRVAREKGIGRELELWREPAWV